VKNQVAEKVYRVSEVARMLDRVPHTIRMWEYHDRLPAHLRSSRDERGWRIWTEAQVDGLKRWIVDEDMRPGKALRGGVTP
jgi:hypothetical protein